MSSLIEILRNSFVVLKKEPKLFVPKIFLSLLWGAFLLYYTFFLKELLQENSLFQNTVSASLAQGFLLKLFFLFGIFLIIFVIDSIINYAYPLMIQNYLNKKSFSIVLSVKLVLKDFFKVIIPIIFSFILMIIVLIPFVAVFVLFVFQKNFLFSTVMAVITFIATIILAVIFYFIYPVAVIEKKGLISVVNTVKKARKNLKEAFFGTFIFSIISLISALIVSFAETDTISVIALIVFALLRIITAVLATYSMVLNPLLYFKK